MASGSLGAEEQPSEKHRWSGNSKVYTRKIRKANTNHHPPKSISTTATSNDQSNENKTDNNGGYNNNHVDNSYNNNHVANGSNNNHIANGSNNNHVANGTAANVNEKDNTDDNDNAPQRSSPPKVPTVPEEANSLQSQQHLTYIETLSEDSFIVNRPEATVYNKYDENLANGLVRPVMTQVDDRVSICVSAAKSTEEIRDLKRKLEDELGQVRKMARRLEAKEIELNSNCSSEIGIDVTSTAVVGSLPFTVNGGLERGFTGGRRAISDVGSVGFSDSRPFRQLSVSVLDNGRVVSEIVEKEKRTPKVNQYYWNSEFLLGKEKLPPAESHRKSKFSGGKKHGGREFDYGFGIDKQLFKSCSNLLQKLMRHKHGWVFNEPVDVKKLGLHDYFEIIKHPMDLGTVKARLIKNWYKTPREFAEDVRLTFHNALTYNPEGQDVHIMAKELLRIFEEKWPAIEVEYDQKLRYEMIRDLGVPTPTSRKTPMSLAPTLLHHPSAFQEVRHLERSQSMPVPPESRSKPVYSMARTPAPKKPKAKDPNKRDMTFEEKQKLSTNLQSLPSEKLDAIVQIIKKRNSALSQHDDEIEVDIDSVDAETLWELDRFVTNYKKSLSKHKRKAELALQARTLAAQAAQETIPASANAEAAKETRTDAGNMAPHVPREKQSENACCSSSSSSSSSDSGSSSSDSDSDSSSGCGSDGGH